MENPGEINLKYMENLKDIYNYMDEVLKNRNRAQETPNDTEGR